MVRAFIRPALLLLTLLSAPGARGASVEPIRYRLAFPAPQSHYVEIEASVPTGGKRVVELMMPVWTPGSYLVREFARQIENLAADGGPARIVKVRKNRWEVRLPDPNGAAVPDRVTVSYRLYCREMGVQTNWVDASFALLNGAATFLTLTDRTPRPHEVALQIPAGWKRSITGLPEVPGDGPHHFVAADFDELVDSPIYAGSPAVYEFKVDGVPHLLVNEGEGGVWDGPRSAKDVEAVVRAETAFWGTIPYKKYIFFNLLTETGGGLEHRNSTVLMFSRWATRSRPSYLNWLQLAAHEFFHTWNVKRLRPRELGPFDYENEVYSKSLWIAEGITSYYDRLFVRRAGLCTVEEYLAGDVPSTGDKPIGDVERLQTTPGRLVQPLESASYDTWIKFYRRDENTANTAVSYYTKGAVVGFLLDAKIRATTEGRESLDDVMRTMYAKYSGANGYTPEEFRAVACEVAGTDLAPWFHRVLETTEELDYSQALDWFGLRFAPEKKGDGKPPKAWLGLDVKVEDGRLVVSAVKRETPGAAAGFNVGDEILGIDDDRIHAGQWSKKMEFFRPGEKVSILVARRDRLIRIPATFGQEPPKRWTLEIDPKATDAQKAHRTAWLGK